MNQYNLCVNIRKRIMTKTAEAFVYDNWSAEFVAEQVKGIPIAIIECDGFDRIDPNNLTKDEMKDLGFGQWDEDSPLMLIPIWLFPFLADEFKTGSISDATESLTKRSEIDNDHRFGCLSYGVLPNN